MVDMFMEVEQARSMTIMATLKLDLPANERMTAVSQCKAKVARAARFVGQFLRDANPAVGLHRILADKARRACDFGLAL